MTGRVYFASTRSMRPRAAKNAAAFCVALALPDVRMNAAAPLARSASISPGRRLIALSFVRMIQPRPVTSGIHSESGQFCGK